MIFQKQPLTRAIEAIALAGGSGPEEAKLVADNLVTANLVGHDSHGIGMMPRYVEALLEGGLHPNRKAQVKLDAASLLALDGQAGYGQSIGRQATELAIERAKQHGVSITALGNSHHLGRIGHWAEMAVAQGLVSMHFVNVRSYAFKIIAEEITTRLMPVLAEAADKGSVLDLQDVFRRTWLHIEQGLRTIERGGASAPEQLADIVRLLLGSYRMSPDLVRVVVLEVTRSGHLRAQVDEIAEAFAKKGAKVAVVDIND